MTTRECPWCKGVVPGHTRRDAIFCRVRCRQASWRFKVGVAPAGADQWPMRFAYADPPYPGLAAYYPEKQEVDHAVLIRRLSIDYPDGWALSTSSAAVRDVLALCPPGVRLAVWVKSPRRVRSRRALATFEALLVMGGRPLPVGVVQYLKDALIYRGRYRGFPGAIVGMKPPQFAEWMFCLLGARHGDTLDDLYPGSGAIGVAWARYTGMADPKHTRRGRPASYG